MPAITNALRSQATAADCAMVEVGDRVEVRQKGKVIAFHVDPSKALNLALDRLAAKKKPFELPDMPDFLRRKADDKAGTPTIKVETAKEAEVVRLIEHRALASHEVPTPPITVKAAPLKKADVSIEVEAPAKKKKPKAKKVAKGKDKDAVKGSIIKPQYRKKYKANGDYSCGDDLAGELRAYLTEGRKHGIDEAKLKEVAMVNGVWVDRYAGHNIGQRRMIIGNRLRHKLAAGERLDIGGAILQNEIDED